MDALIQESELLLDRVLEMGLVMEPWMDEHHCETIEAVMEFIGKVRIELKN